MSRPLVIYHGGCRDGFCAAWVAHRAMPDAEFHAGYYGQPPPDVTNRWVYVVDFSYPRDVMDRMNADAARLVVLDHHKTAQAALEGTSYATFDMNRSGAGMAWDRFFPGRPRPWIVDYIEDRDLWRFAHRESHAVNAYLSVLPFDFDRWTAAANEPLWESFIEGGQLVQAKTDQYVREVAKNARRVTFEGHSVKCVNAPQVDVSELGHALAQGEVFAMAWWQRSDGVFQYSLRSVGDFDVSAIAKKYGGGGHKNAAGFQSSTLLF